MGIFQSDNKPSNKDDKKIDTLEEQIDYLSPLTKDQYSLKEVSEEQNCEDTIKKEGNKIENVAEKGKGVTPFQNHLCNDATLTNHEGSKSKQGSSGTILEDTDNPESIVRDLEARNLERLGRSKLPPQAREVLLLAASLHLREGKGLTVKHLQRLGFEKDNAEKVIQDARRNGLLVPGERREGKQKQYYLANYKHIIDERSRKKNKKNNIVVPSDKDIVFRILRLLSNRKYVYHNIHLETSLNYVKEDYKSINWYTISQKNKQKKFEFKLNLNRNCSIVISTTGTVDISIKCSSEPYEFHTPSGLIEFISSCGQALNEIRHGANNRLEVVPSIPKWYINQFDYNKDIPSSLSKNNRDPEVLSWSSIPAYGRLQVEHLGTIFQIYPKGLPDNGDYSRVEGHYYRKKEDTKNLAETLSDIVEGDNGSEPEGMPFVTAEDMLKKVKENMESINDDDDDDSRMPFNDRDTQVS